MKKIVPLFLFLSLVGSLKAQTPSNLWTPQAIGLLPNNHFILGISVVNKDVVWAVADSASTFTSVATNHIIKVLKTTNGGEKVLQNGQMLEKQNRYLKITTNQKCQPI